MQRHHDDSNWRETTISRDAVAARRRPRVLMSLTAILVMAAATAAFVVPMLITP